MEILIRGQHKVLHLTDGNQIAEAVRQINDNVVNGINFNFIKNFPANLNEIKNAVHTKYIQINGYSWDFDYSAVNCLSELEELSIYTADKREIEYSNFPVLKSTAIFWRAKANSLFKATSLEYLFLGKYDATDLSKLEELRNLKYLRLNTGSVKSLIGIGKLSNLQSLYLMQATKLEDITAIESLSNLRELIIDNCKSIKNIKLLSNLGRQINIVISGTTPKLTTSSD